MIYNNLKGEVEGQAAVGIMGT